jgi:hypothetical protein
MSSRDGSVYRLTQTCPTADHLGARDPIPVGLEKIADLFDLESRNRQKPNGASTSRGEISDGVKNLVHTSG